MGGLILGGRFALGFARYHRSCFCFHELHDFFSFSHASISPSLLETGGGMGTSTTYCTGHEGFMGSTRRGLSHVARTDATVFVSRIFVSLLSVPVLDDHSIALTAAWTWSGRLSKAFTELSKASIMVGTTRLLHSAAPSDCRLRHFVDG
jgi:hypothetical protein